MNNKNITKTLQPQSNTTAFKDGMKDGIPIGLGYLAVSFSLGIMAKKLVLHHFNAF